MLRLAHPCLSLIRLGRSAGSTPYGYSTLLCFKIETNSQIETYHAGLILHGGNVGDCLHAPWSMPWCPWNIPHRVSFTMEKMPWCPCLPFKNEAYRSDHDALRRSNQNQRQNPCKGCVIISDKNHQNNTSFLFCFQCFSLTIWRYSIAGDTPYIVYFDPPS